MNDFSCFWHAMWNFSSQAIVPDMVVIHIVVFQEYMGQAELILRRRKRDLQQSAIGVK